MAFDYFQEDENQDNGQPGQAQQLGQESSIVTGNAPAQGEAGKSSSGSFTNLNSYLEANKDQKFGQQVAGKVTDQLRGAETAQDNSATQFRKSADEGAVSEDQDTLAKLNTSPQDVDYDQYAKMRDASYKGPNSLVDTPDLFTGAQQATEKAYQTANQTKDESGRKAFLQQEYGAGKGRYDYTSGQQKLDNLLIQQDPDSKTAFESAWNQANQTKDRFGTLSSSLDAYAAGKKADTAKTRNDARSALGIDDSGNWLQQGGAINQSLGALDQNVSAKQAELTKNRAALEGAYGKTNFNQLSPEARQLLGIDPNAVQGFNFIPEEVRNDQVYSKDWAPFALEGGSTVGLDPRNYINIANDVDLNRSTLADQQTQARIAALSKLAGKENTFIVPEQAGRMVDQPLYSKTTDIAGSAANRAAAMQSELAAAKAKILGNGNFVDTSKVRVEGNKIRAKYGLPPL